MYIPKPDGGTRPLGIAALEDKIVQKAVVDGILTPIYEAEFLGFSYGFRPGRGAHDALDALAYGIEKRKVNWIADADVRQFFDRIDRGWMLQFLEHRIGDKRLIRLIGRWLNAGVMDDGTWADTVTGTPQGAIVSPRARQRIPALRAGSVVPEEMAVEDPGGGGAHRPLCGRLCATKARGGGRKPSPQPCCARDGGRSSAGAVQAEAANRLLLLEAAGPVTNCVRMLECSPGRTLTVRGSNHHDAKGRTISPNRDRTPVRLRILAVQPLLPWHARAQVENHHMPGFRADAVHGCGRLFQTLPNQAIQPIFAVRTLHSMTYLRMHTWPAGLTWLDSISRPPRHWGVAPSTIHRMLNDGFLAGNQITPGAPWRIGLTEELRQRFVADAPEGYVAMQVATARLRVSRQTVLDWIKRGKLDAITVQRGRPWRIADQATSE